MRDVTTVTIRGDVHMLAAMLARLQGERVGEFVENAILERAYPLVTGKGLDKELLALAKHVQGLRERAEQESKARGRRQRRRTGAA